MTEQPKIRHLDEPANAKSRNASNAKSSPPPSTEPPRNYGYSRHYRNGDDDDCSFQSGPPRRPKTKEQ